MDVSTSSDRSTDSFLRRTFGPINAGSERGSIFTLSATALGSGVLSLPYVMKLNGVVLGSLTIIISAIASYWSLTMLVKASKAADTKDYYVLCIKSGGTGFSKFFLANVELTLFGAIIIYQIICYKSLNQALLNFGVKYANDSGSITWFHVLLVCGPALLIVFPLTLFKNMGSLRYTSLLSLISLLYTILAIIILTPSYLKKEGSTEHVQLFPKKIFDFFNGSAIVFAAYTVQTSLFPVIEQLRNPDDRRINKV